MDKKVVGYRLRDPEGYFKDDALGIEITGAQVVTPPTRSIRNSMFEQWLAGGGIVPVDGNDVTVQTDWKQYTAEGLSKMSSDELRTIISEKYELESITDYKKKELIQLILEDE